MKPAKFFHFVLIALLAAGAYGQKIQSADVVEQNLRKHVEYLASDQLEGRRTGEQGATFASGYIANLFAQYKLKGGLKSTNGKPAYLQTFPYVAGVTLGPRNLLRIVPADALAENKMEIGVNWSPLGFSPSADVPRSPIVFAGYGVVSSDAKYDDYSGLDVKDKIVLVLDGTPDAGNPHSPFARFNTHIKASIAKEKGARALLIIAGTDDFKNDRLSRLSYDQTVGEAAVPVIGIMRQHGAELLGFKDGKELAAFEKWLGERPAGVQIALKNAGTATAEFKTDLVKKQADAYNVIGILEGTDPQLKNEAIVIGAHYDHLGRGGQGSLAVNSSEIHHGADDNASGTSTVVELARQFAKEKKNKRTIIFIAFSGEEEGLLGSNFYVNNPVWPLEKTVAMINLDMVGRLKDGKLNVGGIGTASELKGIVEFRNRGIGFGSSIVPVSAPASKIPMEANATAVAVARASISTPRFNLQLNEDGFGPSDHSSFYGKKVPVLFFFTGTHEDYHKPSDTFEKINYQGLTSIVAYVSEVTQSIDQNPTRPTYTLAKSSGTMGRTGFNVSLGTVPNYADSTDGLLLDGVRDGSAAAKAGIKPGDRIVKLAGREVRNINDYTFVLGEMKAGEEYEVVLKRGAETVTLKIIPAPSQNRPR